MPTPPRTPTARAGTGLDDPAPSEWDTNSLKGGGTGWLTTAGNVGPGEIITLRIAIWDTSDHAYDPLALIDAFNWSVEGAQPGAGVEREGNGPTHPPSPPPPTGPRRPHHVPSAVRRPGPAPLHRLHGRVQRRVVAAQRRR